MPIKKSVATVAVTVPIEVLERRIYLIRGQKVMLDRDLAQLYKVTTKAFNQAARRNRDRFPEDFMFQLTESESSALRSQFVTLEKGRGRYSKYTSLAFTELGIHALVGPSQQARSADEHPHHAGVCQTARSYGNAQRPGQENGPGGGPAQTA
jgi:hypothetical protein